jgi:hypothetical protein
MLLVDQLDQLLLVDHQHHPQLTQASPRLLQRRARMRKSLREPNGHKPLWAKWAKFNTKRLRKELSRRIKRGVI